MATLPRGLGERRKCFKCFKHDKTHCVTSPVCDLISMQLLRHTDVILHPGALVFFSKIGVVMSQCADY